MAKRIALITGASLGIGRAVATRLSRDGHAVVLTARPSDRLDSVCHELTASGGEARAVAADLTKVKDRTNLVRNVESTDGLQVLVHCASAQSDPKAEALLGGTASERMEVIFAATAVAGLQLLKELKDSLAVGAPSQAIFIASDWGLRGSHGPPVFSAAKAALAHGVRSARREFASQGTQLTILFPGDIASYDEDWTEPVWSLDDRPADIRAKLGQSRIPLVDIADTISFVLSRRLCRVEEIILAPTDPAYDY